MASVALSPRVEKVVGYPPLTDMGDLQRREFHEALLDAGAIVRAEQTPPDFRIVGSD